VLVAAGAVLVAGLTWAGTLLVVSRPLAYPDAIVSLASHEWERLPLTTSLALQYPAAIVLLTQPQPASVNNCYHCAERVTELRSAGIGANRITILPLNAPGTYGEALACRDYLQTSAVTRVLIVTSPYHTRRALAIFRTVLAGRNIDLGVVPASAYSPARPRWWWLSPYDLWYVSYEWAATGYYFAKYGVPVAMMTN
jgi:uncharacterized SAM-binding protein YcdF (DUF218 family)